MKDGLKIYQVFYRKNQKKHLDPGFSPWDNRKNRRPEWAELWVMIRALENSSKCFAELTGFVSWKFQQKTGLTSLEVQDFIESHPGYDCYIFNPLTLQTALFASVWEQGEHWHPGIRTHAEQVLRENGLEADLGGYVDGFATTAYCNYFVATPRFWEAYFSLMTEIFNILEKQRTATTGPWQVTRHDNQQYRFIPFIVERFFGVVARLNPELGIIPYRYPEKRQSERTPGFTELITLADQYKIHCRDDKQNPAFREYLRIQKEMKDLLRRSPNPERLLLR